MTIEIKEVMTKINTGKRKLVNNENINETWHKIQASVIAAQQKYCSRLRTIKKERLNHGRNLESKEKTKTVQKSMEQHDIQGDTNIIDKCRQKFVVT